MAEIINPVFEQYRGLFSGMDCIVFGTGPTVDLYEPKDSKIKLGSNEIIYKPYKMDFYFLGDQGDPKRGYISDRQSYDEYRPNIDKFYRVRNGKVKSTVACFDGRKIPANAKPYTYTDRLKNGNYISDDVTQRMSVYATISLEVMQFAVFCGFKRIYLVGMDCDYSNGSFKSPLFRQEARHMVQVWRMIKAWLDGKGIECLVVNPVGLKFFKEGTL